MFALVEKRTGTSFKVGYIVKTQAGTLAKVIMDDGGPKVKLCIGGSFRLILQPF